MNILLIFLLTFVASLNAADKPATPPPVAQEQVQEGPAVQPEQQTATTPEFPTENIEPVSYKGAFTKMMLTLLALVVLIVISVWMLKRIARGRFSNLQTGRSIKIVERRPLSSKSVLYLVEVGSKKVLIAESQLEVRRVATIDELPMSDE